MRSNQPQFHGSDIEAASAYYQIPKEDIICFSSNVNPLGLSADLKEKLAQNLDILSVYPDRNYRELKKALGEYCHTLPEYFLVGNGSTELISVLIQTRRPSRAVIVSPTYSEYGRELSLVHCPLKEYVLDESRQFQMQVSDFCRCIQEGAYELAILCNPNNPTSSALTISELRELLAFCKTIGCFVMIDETYVEFSPDVATYSAMSLLKEFDNFMVLRGVSKFFAAPGMRFGYGATSNQELHEAFVQIQNPWSLNSLGALAGEFMFKDKAYIQQTYAFIDKERTRMYEVLSRCSNLKVYPPYANFILVKILKEGLTSYTLFDQLMKRGLMIRDCSSFESLNGEYIRFCIMKEEENTRLLENLLELLSF